MMHAEYITYSPNEYKSPKGCHGLWIATLKQAMKDALGEGVDYYKKKIAEIKANHPEIDELEARSEKLKAIKEAKARQARRLEMQDSEKFNEITRTIQKRGLASPDEWLEKHALEKAKIQALKSEDEAIKNYRHANREKYCNRFYKAVKNFEVQLRKEEANQKDALDWIFGDQKPANSFENICALTDSCPIRIRNRIRKN